ncbi:MAG: hypothetical protein M3Q51_05745 [Pseudomonadota bacterium]|nr:hypothetical protein [Pseudomonadota bacterium]MDQ3160512.1 hypothetical protein [Pseudomonadota bacterium]
MDEISLEDLALLDVLKRIDQGVELVHGDSVIRQRMVEDGLIDDDALGLRLTTAGIEMCKSLQHRVAADAQVEKILQQRADSETQANPAR